MLIEVKMADLIAITSDKAPAAVGPYSCALEHQGNIYVSGQLPIDAKGNMPESSAEQARQSLMNIKSLLESAGSSLDRVVKTTVFLTNMDDFAAVNEVYAQIMSAPYPARSCIEVSKLPKGAKVEIECIAVK